MYTAVSRSSGPGAYPTTSTVVGRSGESSVPSFDGSVVYGFDGGGGGDGGRDRDRGKDGDEDGEYHSGHRSVNGGHWLRSPTETGEDTTTGYPTSNT